MMPTTDKRIDAYIAHAQPFAQPILKHLRAVVHTACPGVEESMKWSFPHFGFKGEMMCSMAAFKQHCAFGFWKAALMKNKTLLKNAAAETAMGHLGRITSVKDLPSKKILTAWIREAAALNEAGIKVKKRPAAGRPKPLKIPFFFLAALKRNAQARRVFDEFSYSNKKEYVEWVTEAKSDSTRERRLATAMEWMAEGKVRNWKYMTAKK